MLNHYLSGCDSILNKTPNETKTALLVGLGIIQKRLKYDFESVEDFNKAVE